MALVLAIGSLSTEGGFRRYARLNRDLHALEDRIERLRAENAALKREVQRVRTDPVAIERSARESLGLVRPGEVVLNLEAP